MAPALAFKAKDEIDRSEHKRPQRAEIAVGLGGELWQASSIAQNDNERSRWHKAHLAPVVLD